jgi:hypothetical protein
MFGNARLMTVRASPACACYRVSRRSRTIKIRWQEAVQGTEKATGVFGVEAITYRGRRSTR